jgi:hypothetical protein
MANLADRLTAGLMAENSLATHQLRHRHHLLLRQLSNHTIGEGLDMLITMAT